MGSFAAPEGVNGLSLLRRKKIIVRNLHTSIFLNLPLEVKKLKLYKKKRGNARTKEIKKIEREIQKHSDWINLSLMTEAATESSFQFLFQSILAMPATLGLLKHNRGSVDDLLTIQNFSIAASFVSFGMACVSIRYFQSA